MDTNESIIKKFGFNNIKNKKEKEVLARKIASKVKNGDVISFGSGTTSFLATIEIGKKCKEEKIKIIAIPTSMQIEQLCNYLDIQTAQLGEYQINWGFDGADEVDKNNWLIKGLGGALYREKMNLKQTPVVYILVDKTKLVDKLDNNYMVPVECYIDKIDFVIEDLKRIGAMDLKVRKEKNNKDNYITDNGNYIIDARFEIIDENMEERINKIDGVLENGLFINYKNIEIIVS